MTMEPSKDYVLKCLELANEMLEDAKLLLDKGRLRSTVDRSYSAMRYATQAILYDKGFKPKSHAGLISMFGQHVVNKGIVEKEFGKSLSQTFDSRQKSDYEIYVEFGKEGTEEIVKIAEKFVVKIKDIVK